MVKQLTHAERVKPISRLFELGADLLALPRQLVLAAIDQCRKPPIYTGPPDDADFAMWIAWSRGL